MKQFLFLITGLLLVHVGYTQSSPATINLRPDWKVLEKESFVTHTDQKVKTIHFSLDKRSIGARLFVYDKAEFSLFINGKLVARKRDTLHLRVDSLWSRYQGAITISIYQHQPVYSLKTWLELPIQKSELDNPVRSKSFFNDFIILAVFILLVFMVILFRINPRLTVDYLNVVKLFSIQERDEAIVAGRIGSSVNLFFFALISFMLALLLLIIMQEAPDQLRLAGEFTIKSTVQAFIVWVLLSLVIFMILIAKLVVIGSFSLLFSLRDTVRFQFFSFIRLLFVTTMVMGCVAVVYFIMQIQQPGYFYHLLTTGSVIVSLGTIILFLKLLARTSFPIFHLFSYLCATEVIPLMILGKVFLF